MSESRTRFRDQRHATDQVAPQEPPKMQIRQSVTKVGNCKDCRWWSRDYPEVMVMTQEGGLIPERALKAQIATMVLNGAPINPDHARLPRSNCAACTRFPQWQMQPDEHYCGEFEPLNK